MSMQCSHVNWWVTKTKSYISDEWDWIRFWITCECGATSMFSRRVVTLMSLSDSLTWSEPAKVPA